MSLEDKVESQEPPVINTNKSKMVDLINKAGKYLHMPLLKLFESSAFFILIYLVGWSLNAIYANLHFDLNSLKDFYLLIAGKQTIEHSANSFLNSPRGIMPNKED